MRSSIGFFGCVILLGAVLLFVGVAPFAFFAILSVTVGMWLLGHKIRSGFGFISLGCAAMMLKAVMHEELGMFAVFGTLAVMSAMNHRKWGHKDVRPGD